MDDWQTWSWTVDVQKQENVWLKDYTNSPFNVIQKNTCEGKEMMTAFSFLNERTL